MSLVKTIIKIFIGKESAECIRYTFAFLLLLMTTINASAQTDSFWLRNLNLVGAPKAVFALDDGYSIVLADSFDQASKLYKGIMLFKIDPNGKTVKRKRLFELDTAYLEQRLEKAEKVRDGYLFRWYYTYYKNDSVVKSKSYFAKINDDGEVLQNVETVVNYYGKAGVYWWRVQNDTIIDFPLNIIKKQFRYSLISTGKAIDSIPHVGLSNRMVYDGNIYSIGWNNVRDKYDSVYIDKYSFALKKLSTINRIYLSQRMMQFSFPQIITNGYIFLGSNHSVIKTDTSLNILWQTPPKFVNAIEEEIIELQILKNGDILVIGNTQMANGQYAPYYTSIAGDGSRRNFQYAMPSFITSYHNFSEGSNGELFFLISSNSNETYLAKTSSWGQLNSIEKPKSLSIKIFPNPFSHNVFIRLNKSISADISIINMTGRVVNTIEIENKRSAKLDLSNLPNGSYKMIINPKDGTLYSKTLVKF